MLGTKKLQPVIETGIGAVRKADDAIRLCMILTAAGLILQLCTLIAVLARRPCR